MHTQQRIIFNRDVLVKYRLQYGLTQQQLAKKLGTSTNVVSYWETGKRTPLPKTVDRISSVLNLPHAVFYGVNSKTFGTKLTTIRLIQNISQRDMAEAIGTSAENINRWEADKHVPSTYFIYHIARVLGISMEELITNDEGDLLLDDPYS